MAENGGRVLEIQRMSTEDGPGLRTTVFLKGCSLKCLWCHNPESIAPGLQVEWSGVKCIGCGLCLEACPEGGLRFGGESGGGGIVIDRNLCRGCGQCTEICPSGALRRMGERWEAEALVGEILKDRTYFEKSGGGVTVSGGEPVLQPDFTYELLRRLREEGIHTSLDTCGAADPAALGRLLPWTDLLLFDLKLADEERHRECTGLGNHLVRENLKQAAASGTDMWIRTPVIPGCTDTTENIRGLAGMLNDLDKEFPGAGIRQWELLAFNNLCADKYQRLGAEWALEGRELLDEEVMIGLHGLASELVPLETGIRVCWSGSVKKGVCYGES